VGGDEEDDEEREEVDEAGAERGHGGGVARHGDAAGEGERAGVAEEGREGVGRLVARAHPRGGPEHQLSRDACSLPLCLRLPRGMGWAAGWLRFCADRSRAHGGRGAAIGSGSRHGRGGWVRCGAAVFWCT